MVNRPLIQSFIRISSIRYGAGSILNEARKYGKDAPSFAPFFTELEDFCERMPRGQGLTPENALKLKEIAQEFIDTVDSKGGPSRKEPSLKRESSTSQRREPTEPSFPMSGRRVL